VLAIVLPLTALAIGGTFIAEGWWPGNDAEQARGDDAPPQTDAPKPQPKTTTKDVKSPGDNPASAKDTGGPARTLAHALAAGVILAQAGGADELRPPLRRVQDPRVVGTETLLDAPDGEYIVDALRNGKTLKLVGKLQRLTVGEINDRAVLDATQLEVKEIILLGGILNNSQVKLNAPDGVVEIYGQLNGNVVVSVNAPGGSVTFAKGGIFNGSRIEVKCRSLEFADRLEGPQTMVTAKMSTGAQVKFRTISNSAKLHVQKANPKDRPIEVIGGDVYGQGEFRRLN
jgi:hypothetical protein